MNDIPYEKEVMHLRVELANKVADHENILDMWRRAHAAEIVLKDEIIAKKDAEILSLQREIDRILGR